ncbi:uncharacterized protein LOC113236462 [Hyposmocoma kahamanoa]|uniref:uncharacterized protein LOC113236462 n=1 Tax=Hyposmocoma kahamanoa TaxID=1477025 RepID=UPI000E6D72A1|nr:uncharacterized protein LOC113236462 [Hyposmocoma kahamanoa]
MDSTPSNNDMTPVMVMDTNQTGPSDLLVTTGSSAQPRSRLSGSRRRRLQGLMRAGKSYAEALQLSEKPWSELTVPKPLPKVIVPKRDLAEKVSPQEHIRKAPRTMAQAESRIRPTFSEVAGSLLVSEALQLSEKPWSELAVLKPIPKPIALKRDLSEKASPQEHTRKAPRTMTQAESRIRPAISEMADSLRVGIRNSEPMTEEQMELVKLFLVRTIASTKSHGEGPKFMGLSHKSGWILVTCKDHDSADWLEEKIGNLHPWPEAKLSFIKESELPKPITATTYIPEKGCESVQMAISLLEAQNSGQNCGKFFTPGKTRTDGSSRTLWMACHWSISGLQTAGHTLVLNRLRLRSKGARKVLLAATMHGVSRPRNRSR